MAAGPVDDAGEGAARFATLPTMSIEMPAAEVYGLANRLRTASGDAEEIAAGLRGTPEVGSPTLQAAVDTFFDSHRTAGRAIAGELAWLGGAIEGVAHSWLRLDGALLGRPGGPTRE
jgi:hypothetical protein